MRCGSEQRDRVGNGYVEQRLWRTVMRTKISKGVYSVICTLSN